MLPMARSDPELAVVNVGRYDLFEPSLAIFRFYKVHQCVVDVGAIGQEETAARA